MSDERTFDRKPATVYQGTIGWGISEAVLTDWGVVVYADRGAGQAFRLPLRREVILAWADELRAPGAAE